MSKGYSERFGNTLGCKAKENNRENKTKDYNEADSDKIRTVNEINEIDNTNHERVPTKGLPNSVLKIIKNGKTIRERYFDEDGDPYLDIDYDNHGNPKTHPIVPHQHSWAKDEKGNLTRHNIEEIIRKKGKKK